MSGLRGIPCNDTVFIRGFSAKRRVEDIRNFFLREAGHNGVEFCRESNEGKLLIALKFDSRAVAKEVIDRFHDIEVLGDRITVCLYKEMRKSYINNTDQGSYRRGPQNQQWGQDRNYNNRGGTRGDGPPYRDRGSNVNGSRFSRTVTRRDDRPAHRRLQSRSTSGSRSRSKSPQSPRSRSVSSSNDERASRSKSGGSHDRSHEHHSSSDGTKRDRSSRKVKAAKPGRDAKKNVTASDSSQSDNGMNASPSPQFHKRDKKLRMVHKEISAEDSSEDSQTSSSEDEHPINSDAHSQQEVEYSTPVGRSELRSAVQMVPAVKKNNDPKTPIDSEFLQDHSSSSESSGGEESMHPALSRTSFAAEKSTGSKKLQPQLTKVKEEQSKDNFSGTDFTPADNVRRLRQAQLQQNETTFTVDSANLRTSYSPSSVNSELDDSGFKMPNAVPPSVLLAKKRKSVEDRRFVETDNLLSSENTLKRARVMSKNVISDGKGFSAGNFSSKRKPSSESTNWIPPDKMALVHEKKADIEKAYKQDCETFATVTKMLISKDPGIEDRIQACLKENLKEIGQRCIQELRDFIETLKEEQQDGED